MAVLRRIVLAAALAGVLAGILLTAIQQIEVIPILLEAEGYEVVATGIDATAQRDEWQPENGWQRTFANAAFWLSLGSLLGHFFKKMA